MNRAKNIINLIEDLWPASKPGFPPGISATTQLVPEQKKYVSASCHKCGKDIIALPGEKKPLCQTCAKEK